MMYYDYHSAASEYILNIEREHDAEVRRRTESVAAAAAATEAAIEEKPIELVEHIM